jgi:hypothetical protein
MNTYNIKYNLIHYLFKISNIDIKNINNKVITKIYYYSHSLYEEFKSNIICLKINFIKTYFYVFNYNISSFTFEIPINDLKKLKKLNTFILFDEYINNIWNNNNGILMYEYIISNPIEKIIYFELFKKIFLRINII